MPKSKIKYYLRALFFLTFALVLAGCEPKTFGVPKAQFDQASPDERTQIIQNYNDEQAQKQQRDAILGAVGGLLHSMNIKKDIPLSEDKDVSESHTDSYRTGPNGEQIHESHSKRSESGTSSHITIG